jgi:hypothetical protein
MDDLTDKQWDVLGQIIGEPPRRDDNRGRPWCDNRQVLNGILWILRTGAQWRALPKQYPSYQTCHRRFQQWLHEGTLDAILWCISETLHMDGVIDLSECFIDGSFVGAKKGGSVLAKPSAARALK